MKKLCFVKEDHLFLYLGGETKHVFLKLRLADLTVNGWNFEGNDGGLRVALSMGRYSGSLVTFDEFLEECK